MTSVSTTTIVDVAWLRDAISASPSDVAVIEVTGDESHDGGAGVIPGSRSIHWKPLLWHDTRRELATARTLAGRLRDLGVGADTEVVLAGAPTQFAAYAIWVATVAGVADRLHYLDGGLAAWSAAGSGGPARAVPPVSTLPAPTRPTPSHPRPSVVIDRAGVENAIGSASTGIVDLRSPQEFSGQRVSPETEIIDHGAQRHGRIPGARALHVAELLDDDTRILPVDQLRERVRAADLDSATDLVFYCRLSHRAALGWLIFDEVLGDSRVRVYDGSWTEWGSVVGAPIEL
ncbi:MAG: rhodanese-like domain-containing protein [Corynebacteriales bacterium]|nr:rhodanese-like domain-containing protein [Mycobacteriales bacterium]